jgi:regulator of replication initiation timing
MKGGLLDGLDAALIGNAEMYDDWWEKKHGIKTYRRRLREERDALQLENDRLRYGLQVLATTFYKEDQHQDYAKHVLKRAAAFRPLPRQEDDGR